MDRAGLLDDAFSFARSVGIHVKFNYFKFCVYHYLHVCQSLSGRLHIFFLFNIQGWIVEDHYCPQHDPVFGFGQRDSLPALGGSDQVVLHSWRFVESHPSLWKIQGNNYPSTLGTFHEIDIIEIIIISSSKPWCFKHKFFIVSPVLRRLPLSSLMIAFFLL